MNKTPTQGYRSSEKEKILSNKENREDFLKEMDFDGWLRDLLGARVSPKGSESNLW